MPVRMRDPLDPRTSHWHWLAYQMRCLRELHGLSLTQVGNVLGLARGTVSNFEAGRRKPGEDYARELDRLYKTGDLLQMMLFHARMGHDPDWHVTFTSYERDARVLRIYHGQAVPGPVQTEATVRAHLAAGRSLKDTERLVEARLARQAAILDRDEPPFIWILLDESVLGRETGGRETLRAQLVHLHEVGRRSNVSIRVFPRAAGACVGMDGPFRIASLDARDVVYAGAQRGGRLIESPAEVREILLDWEFMCQRALSDDDSRALIAERIGALP